MIVIDGNDGTGKTTIVNRLRAAGYLVADRGLPTKMTDDPLAVSAAVDAAFVILDAPVECSRDRLAAAGRNLNEKYHTVEDLTHYRRRFQEVATHLGVPLIDASGDAETVFQGVLRHLRAREFPRVAIPTGRLERVARSGLGDMRITVPDTSDRSYRLPVTAPGIQLVRLKARSIPQAVALGMVEAGFCGSDIVSDSMYADSLDPIAVVGLPATKMCVLARDHEAMNPRGRPVVIATEYPAIAGRWAYERRLAHVCVQTYGTTEAWVPELADIAIDVVETGNTLAANGLRIVCELGRIDTWIVVPKHDGAIRHHEFFARARGTFNVPKPGGGWL